MLSLFYLPLFASAALGASHFQHRDFHHRLAREHARSLAPSNVTVPPMNATNATVDMVAAAYYAGWHAANFTLDDVSWEKYTHMIYAFAYVHFSVSSQSPGLTVYLGYSVTGPDTPNNVTLTSDDDELLTQMVAKAKNSSVKAMLSIGGWTGGRSFSTNVGSAENRTAFVQTVVDLKTKYDLDGVDFE